MKPGLLSIVLLTAFSNAAISQSMPEAALKFLDQDQDLVVTREDMSQQMDLLFDPMDANGNGRLEFNEVESFMSRGVFDDADSNANGTVSKSEYREQVLEDFEAADVDGDGVLD